MPIIVELKSQGDAKRNAQLNAMVDAMLRTYEGVFCVESFHPALVAKADPHFVRGMLGCKLDSTIMPSFFFRVVVNHFLAAFIAHPQFFAVRVKDWHRSWVKLAARVWSRTSLVLWTVHSMEEVMEAKNDPRFVAVIFDSFVPDRS